jgi:hypothetical protein
MQVAYSLLLWPNRPVESPGPRVPVRRAGGSRRIPRACSSDPGGRLEGVRALAKDAEERLREERAQFAEFGLLAVEGADLDGLLQQAAAEAAHSLASAGARAWSARRG